VTGCMQSLKSVNVSNITTHAVPGAYELPFAAQKLIKSGKYDVCVCIGVLIKGSTMHFEYIADAVSNGIMRVGLDSGVPVIFGLLTCLNELQALERSGLAPAPAKSHNHGLDWGLSAVEMAYINKL
jgi:6,7-dimethyl-8-ribityllumazine synthase